MKINTPPPHGGKLVERVERDHAKSMDKVSGCPAFEIKPTYDGEMAIRNPYREIMSICYGFFSPLKGSMTRNEVYKVMKERRLLNEWIFPFPIMFDIDESDIKTLGVKEGDRLLLTLKKRPFAYIDIDEIYAIDPKEVATLTFGTPERAPDAVKAPFDAKHPGYNMYRKMHDHVIAGNYTIINEPVFRSPFDRFWYPPRKSREEFKARGWRTVIVHQTRNVPHLGHEFLMKNAAFAGDIEPSNGILVNAIVGAKRIGDYPDEMILEAHEAVHKANYVKPERHMVTFLPWDMRYGGPLESVLHGIVRQNMGCTHHMWGRDHAAVGSYYDPFSTQRLWDRGIPGLGFEGSPNELDHGLKIIPQNMGEFWYCPKCGEIAYNATCGHTDMAQKFSGSFIRSMIAEGVHPPSVIMRPEVYDVIVKWWKILGYPFNNLEYLKEKEKELEVNLPEMELEISGRL